MCAVRAASRVWCVCAGSGVPGLLSAACAVGAQSVVPGVGVRTGVRPERVWSKPARNLCAVSPLPGVCEGKPKPSSSAHPFML